MAKIKDVFVNRAIQRLTQSAPNVLTFQQVNFAVGAFQGIALLIHRVKYHVGATAFEELLVAADSWKIGLTVSANISDIAMTHIEVIDVQERTAGGAGILNDFAVFDQVLVEDFGDLPGGGMLIPANPVHLACSSAGLTTGIVADVEILFTFKELVDADYIELIQSRMQANV